MKRLLIALFLLPLTFVLTACEEDKPTPVKAEQAAKARAAANSINFTENAEIDNIKKRLELTSKNDLVGFIILLNESGQPVMYTSIKGKPTSGGKRLTEPDRYWGNSTHAGMRAAPSDEGTYGSSGEYVFFWTVDGQYMQWNGKYLYSDKPFRLSVQPLVVNVKE
jgi:hypothetical protein